MQEFETQEEAADEADADTTARKARIHGRGVVAGGTVGRGDPVSSGRGSVTINACPQLALKPDQQASVKAGQRAAGGGAGAGDTD